MNRLILILLNILCPLFLGAQELVKLNWDLTPNKETFVGKSYERPTFEGATFKDVFSTAPRYYLVRKIKPNQSGQLKITPTLVAPLEDHLTSKVKKSELSSEFKVTSSSFISSNESYVNLSVIPLRINATTGIIEKLIQFKVIEDLKYKPQQKNSFPYKNGNTSPLASGKWYKLGVTSDGIYKLDKSYIESLGINSGSIDPRKIRIFGNSTGMLPESIKTTVPTTLQECAIKVVGESDGTLDAGDYVLFYAKGPHRWDYNEATKTYSHVKHLFTDTAYYFINVDSENGKRIQTGNANALPINQTITKFQDHQFHESDQVNLIKTGRDWFGEYFDITTKYTKSFTFPNISTSDSAWYNAKFAVRSLQKTGNTMSIKHNGKLDAQLKDIALVQSHYLQDYAVLVSHSDSVSPSSSTLNFEFSYSKPLSSSVAWLDYIEVVATRSLAFSGSYLFFRNGNYASPTQANRFQVSNASNVTEVWNLTDPLNINTIPFTNGANINVDVAANTLQELAAINANGSFSSPIKVGTFNNQNLLSLIDVDYIMISHPDFMSETNRLADFHRNNSGLTVEVVEPNQVYNEFSSGAPDVTAIRNFMKYLYDNATDPQKKIKYLFLMGDGSYDPRLRLKKDGNYFNTNFILTYQSIESVSPTRSFTTDDYFALLDDTVDISDSKGFVDIGVGRFPADNLSQAKGFVDKVIHYASGSNDLSIDGTTIKVRDNFGDWKNKISIAADDGNTADSYTIGHTLDSETVFDTLFGVDSTFNANKIYMYSFQKESTSGGERYPDVEREIMESMNEGTLVMSYFGHGGEAGWADEEVLTIDDIFDWKNPTNFPIFLTATCEFSRFDDPNRTAAGEYVILRENGGAVAMLTTVRLVYGGPSNNVSVARSFIRTAFGNEKHDLRLGDVIRKTKLGAQMGTFSNKRKFSLLGDPGLKMGIPKHNVVTTKINGVNASSFNDTIKALSKVEIEGEVKTQGGSLLSNYNGILYVTVFDKFVKVNALDNNSKDISYSFQNQSSIIYKGKVTATNGKFKFEFVVPKDINYSIGKGKISYYVANESEDGAGFSQEFSIGGSSDQPIQDNTGPTIQMFMNDTNFVNGGLTNQDPVFIAYLDDDNGINTTGNSIGHDILLTIDGNTSESIVLNNSYEADLNSYKSGKVKYQMENLSDGEHTLKLKVWDVNNNSNSATLDFVVSSSSELALEHVLNYPNPFTTSTKFYFEHNYPSNSLKVRIKIYTITGKIVKTIEQDISNLGSLKSNGINWDGLDDFGDKIGKGVYMYQLEVEAEDGKKDKKIEKLVILR